MQAAKHHKKVSLVEWYKEVGGGCTHWGTIPSKALRHDVQRLLEMKKNPLFSRAMDGCDFTFPQLLKSADTAMYSAKNKGRSRFELFDEALRFEALRVHDLEGDLRRSLATGNFMPYFQPIVQLSDRRIIGYEALLRWHHPDHGAVDPGARGRPRRCHQPGAHPQG